MRPVPPAPPDPVDDADLADPGEMAEVKAEQVKTESGKYGSPRPDALKQEETEEEAEEKSWIELHLIDEDGDPVAGAKYQVTAPDGRVADGTLDNKGWARVEGFDPGECDVEYPDFDNEALEYIGSSRKQQE